MAHSIPTRITVRVATRAVAATDEPASVRRLLIGVALTFLAIFLFLPLAVVFTEALRAGVGAYWIAITEPDARAAIRFTLARRGDRRSPEHSLRSPAAWAIGKFEFRGKQFLTTLIDLPFAVSPGHRRLDLRAPVRAPGWFGPWLREHDIQILFAVPGILLATMFITFPFVARELIPLMEAQGARRSRRLGFSAPTGWQTFWRVTLPNVRWGLLYGVILANARAMGEFGAVSVVSGHIRGRTNTMPLHVEVLYNEYNFVAAFAVASLLAFSPSSPSSPRQRSSGGRDENEFSIWYDAPYQPWGSPGRRSRRLPIHGNPQLVTLSADVTDRLKFSCSHDT
jgi:sulfate/thiosulfate transport system permease protein